jgi:flagellar basal-body rod modification protein FlgD
MPIPAILASVAGAVVSGLVQKATESGGQTETASNVLGKDDFLRLYMAQLRNQDPLNPMSNTDLAAQMAQFSSLEQLQNANKLLEQMAAQSSGGGAASASALLGKTVTVNGSPLVLNGTQPGSLAYALPGAASSVAIRVIDATGKTVRTMIAGQQGQGVHQVAFDGLDDQGRRLPSGTYTYQVAAADAAGNAVPGVYTGSGQVTGISMDAGRLVLLLGNQRVPLTSVVSDILTGRGITGRACQKRLSPSTQGGNHG